VLVLTVANAGPAVTMTATGEAVDAAMAGVTDK